MIVAHTLAYYNYGGKKFYGTGPWSRSWSSKSLLVKIVRTSYTHLVIKITKGGSKMKEITKNVMITFIII